MRPNLRKTWTKVWTAIGSAGHYVANWFGRQRWLRQPLVLLRRIPALLRPIGRQLRRIPDAMRALPRPLCSAGRALRRVPALLWTVPRLLLRLGTGLKCGLTALGRLPSSAGFWSLVAGLLTVPLGAFLMVAPVRELAGTPAFDLDSLLTATWLLAGVATLTAGLGMLFRAPSFRSMLWLAMLCSLLLSAASGYRANTLMRTMQGADAATQHTIDPGVDSGIRQMLLSLGLSACLGVLLWLRPLRRLQCTTPLLRGRAGIVLAPCYGGAFGMGAGYALWFGLDRFAERDDMQFLRHVLGIVRVEHLACGCGAICALWLLRRWWNRRHGTLAHALRHVKQVAKAPSPALVAPSPALAPTAVGASPAPAPPTPTQPASARAPTPARRPQPAGSMPSRP